MSPEKTAALQQLWANWLLAAGLSLTILGAFAGFASAIIGGKASDRFREIGQERTAAAQHLAESAEGRAAFARRDAAEASKQAADANLAAASARERAANLELKSEMLRARLDATEHAVSGRRLTEEQMDSLAKAVSGKLHHPIAVDADWRDFEATNLALDVQRALIKGGAIIQREYGMPSGSTGGSPLQVTLYAPDLIGTKPFPHILEKSPNDDPLYKALADNGFSVSLSASVLQGIEIVTPGYYSLRIEQRGPAYLTK